MSLSKCIFLQTVTSHQWAKRSGECGLNCLWQFHKPYGRQDLGFPFHEDLCLDTLVRCHFWSHEKKSIFTSFPRVSQRTLGVALAVQPRPACRVCGCLSTKSINTLQAAKRYAENNSPLVSIAPKNTWQERNLPGRCYRNNPFEVSTLIISILCL